MQTSLRLPRDLYDRLVKAAGDRGIGEEIRQRLEASLGGTPTDATDPRFADLLTTAGYAAAAAARMFPARKVRVSRALAHHMFPGERIGEDGREVDDSTAFKLFESGCLPMLLDAFRPNGIPDGLPNDHEPFWAELFRRADRIVGAALVQLGERGIDAFNRLAPIDQETIAAGGATGRRLAIQAERCEDGSEQ
jgi:hypothetical protein